MDFNEMIRKYFNENDFEISDLQVEQFLKFYDFLIEKNFIKENKKEGMIFSCVKGFSELPA